MTSPPPVEPPFDPHAESLMEPTQHITGPAELAQAVPYLLGFHPAASLVLVGLAHGRLVVTARLDLADEPDAPLESLTEHTVGAMHRGGSRQFVGLIYPGPDTDERRVAAALHAAVARVQGTVRDVLWVAGGRWRSLECTVASCCPPEGEPLPSGPSAFATAATVSGVVALPDRAAVGRQLDPVASRDELRPLLEQAEHAQHDAVLNGRDRRRLRATKRAILAAARAIDDPDIVSASTGGDSPGRVPASLDDTTVARFGVALGEVAVRDAAWTAIDERRVDGRALWLDLARRLPPPYDAPALFLFGWATWRHGDGALAGMAAERAVSSDPSYSAADLLLAALANGVDPRALPRMRLPRPA